MKMQNVYIGQYHDIRHSAVYADIREAVKEVMRPNAPGTVFQICFLPESKDGKYWVAGTIGSLNWDPRYNQIFTESSKAEQHVDALLLRGWPKAAVLVKELKINAKGPDNIDIKTEEHYRCEVELAAVHRALERGLPCANAQTIVPFTLQKLDGGFSLSIPPGFALIDLSTAGWSTFDTATLWDNVKTAARLLDEISRVDPDSQPRKWARLQTQAQEFGIFHAEHDRKDDPNDDPQEG
jgi:hypothetical protein